MDRLEYKIKKRQLEHEFALGQLDDLKDITKALLGNPVAEIFGTVILCELLHRQFKLGGQPVISGSQSTLIQGSMGAIVLAKELAPLLPFLTQAAGELINLVRAPMAPVEGLTKLLPAAAAAAG